MSLFLTCRFSVEKDGQRMDVRQTRSAAFHGDNHGGEDYVAFFNQYLGFTNNPVSSLHSRMRNAAARNTSWVVKVPGNTPIPAFVLLRIGTARTTILCGSRAHL